MTKIEKPYKNGFCEKCKYSEQSQRNLLCALPVIQAVSDKALACKNFKVCFAFKEQETEQELNNEQ